MNNKMSIQKYRGTTSEATEQRKCLEYLTRLRNFTVWRNNTGVGKYDNKDGSKRFVRYGVVGLSDIMGSYHKDRVAVPFYFEVKKKGGRLTSLQRDFIQASLDNGCYAHHGDFDDLLKYIEYEGLDTSL